MPESWKEKSLEDMGTSFYRRMLKIQCPVCVLQDHAVEKMHNEND